MAVMFVFHSVVFGWLAYFLCSGLFGTRKSYGAYVYFSSIFSPGLYAGLYFRGGDMLFWLIVI